MINFQNQCWNFINSTNVIQQHNKILQNSAHVSLSHINFTDVAMAKDQVTKKSFIHFDSVI